MCYFLGAMKCNKRSLDDLWKIDRLGCTMSVNRFRFLLRCLQFNDIHDINVSRLIDNMSHIRYVFDSFVFNCKNAYSVSKHCTIGVKLQPFQGHNCPFKVTLPSKPAEYGLKLFALVDSVNFYTLNIELYVGEQPKGPFSADNSTFGLVTRLSQPILNTGRNITFDNRFTSFPLAEYLLRNKTTMVGALDSNHSEIPPEFFAARSHDSCSSYFGFAGNKSIVSYKVESNEPVLVASTMHADKTMVNKAKPKVISFYNSTRSGVNTMDQMIENYSVARKSSRWTLAVFYCLLNIGGLNSVVVYRENTREKLIHLTFLKTLGRQLMEEQLKYRSTISNLPKQIKTRLQNYVLVSWFIIIFSY